MIDRIEFIKGQTLNTLARKVKFDILDVDKMGIDIFVHSTKHERHISRREIEKSWEYLVTTGNISAAYIMNSVPSRSSVYIAAILAQLPEVSYSVRPVVLTLKK